MSNQVHTLDHKLFTVIIKGLKRLLIQFGMKANLTISEEFLIMMLKFLKLLKLYRVLLSKPRMIDFIANIYIKYVI